MASDGQQFVQMLKQIGYPDANNLDAASFHWMFDDRDLKPIVETLCQDISQENILTSEEISEYSSLLSSKVIHTPLYEKLLHLEDKNTSEEMQEEMSDLQADVTHLEKYIKLLENQKNLLSMQQIELVQKIDELETLHKVQQQEIRYLQEVLLPEAVNKKKDAVQSSINLVEELNLAFENAALAQNADNAKAFFQVDFANYVECEEKVLKSVQSFLNNSFQEYVAQAGAQSTKDEILDCFIPQLSSGELQMKQASQMQVLKKVLQISEEDYVNAVLEVMKLESQIKFCRDLIESGDFRMYNLPKEQLQSRLEQAVQRQKQHKKEEEELKANITKAISAKVQKHCDYIATLSTKEKLQRYEDYCENLQRPLDVLFSQRARLEFLQMAMTIEKNDLKDHHGKVQSLRKDIEGEIAEIQQHKMLFEENKNEKSVDNDSVPEDSVLYAANEILSKKLDKELLFVTTNDVQRKFKKQMSEKENLVTESEALLKEQLHFIKTVEKSIDLLEEHVHGNQMNAEHPSYLIENLNSSLKKLNIQVQDFEGKLLKEMTNFQKRKMSITQNSHLAKARKLFVYALTNQEKFACCIKEIQEQVGSTGSHI